ncbi:PKD domain-containing protein [Lentzea sp. E54]|uniref:PKD domain-containing protein n=1 Tax=Lentzea xerophila TaxID=3435883 RepID=UPI003DA59859
MPSCRSLAVAAAVLMGVLVPGVAHAAPPSNDDFGASTTITALPYSVEQDTTEATKAADDPYACQGDGLTGSVWFTYTATENGLLRLKTEGSDRDLHVTTFTGERGDLKQVWNPMWDGCTTSRTTPITFPATAGTTYHFMVSGNGTPGGALKLALDRIAPVANDDFANARPVTSLPFSAPKPDFTLASAEPDEPAPTSCSGSQGLPSVWYAFTPTRTQSLVVKMDASGGGPYGAVYEGTSLPELRMLACVTGYHYSGKAVGVTEGRTYYMQVTGLNDRYPSPATLRLSEAAPLQTELYGSSEERPLYETIGFSVRHNNSYEAPVTTSWDFGDGTTAPPSTETSQQHKYAKDGEYTVTVNSTSSDGRTSSDTTVVKIKTHDVGITRFAVPSSARAGQQKTITVQVANTRYLEKPTVTLYRSDGDSWEQVGQLSIEVPAHPTRKVNFPFAYTFTPEDAAIGKVTFRAVVLPWPTQDAREQDNEVIAIATTVHPAATVAAAALTI